MTALAYQLGSVNTWVLAACDVLLAGLMPAVSVNNGLMLAAEACLCLGMALLRRDLCLRRAEAWQASAAARAIRSGLL